MDEYNFFIEKGTQKGKYKNKIKKLKNTEIEK